MSQQVRKYNTVLAEKGVMPERGCVTSLLTQAHIHQESSSLNPNSFLEKHQHALGNGSKRLKADYILFKVGEIGM